MLLIFAGADVNAKNVESETPLMKAARRGSVECVQALLKRGADSTVRDNEGKSALALAREGGNDDVVSLLKDHGAPE